ncbi:MAG: hypothetical protein BWY38_03234 [Ignavibacteria bacterium ADurb.Bin266]|nr:MAG: hypothetical protein BWY38_03234 [Ignavibacteria bacterium ADurb.Bin266]
MKNQIYINDWLILKPYDKQVPTDFYYLKISNEVKDVISKKELGLNKFLESKDIVTLSCFLTSYFEDIISETHIWNSFVNIHKRLYGKTLPFYHVDDYYEDEINPQDICFLIWYFLNTFQKDKFVIPFNSFILYAAEKVYDIFDKHWEYAPENEQLKNYYTINENEKDYYQVRNLIDNILFNSYLFFTDVAKDFNDKATALFKTHGKDKNIHSYFNELRDETLHNTHTALLALTGKEWTAEIIGKKHPLHHLILNISQKVNAYFLYKGQDETDIFLEHIATDTPFKLTKKSFDFAHTLKEINTIVFIGMVKWDGEWWFSGTNFTLPYNANIILDEKNSVEKRAAINFLYQDKAKTEGILKEQFNVFKKYNNGSPIAFMIAEDIEKFLNGYLDFYNKSLNLTEKEISEAKQRGSTKGFFKSGNKIDFSHDKLEPALVFFNEKKGVEIVLGLNSAFPLPNNPFFDKKLSEKHIMHLLVDNSTSIELVLYLIKNYKSKLPFFKTELGKVILKDLDFLLRFWKKMNYFSGSYITLI